MTGTVSRDELDWVFIAFLGILAASADVVLAIREVGAHWHDKGPVRGIAISGLVKSTLLCAMTMIGVFVGVLAMLTPEPVRPDQVRYQDAIINGLITYQALLVMVVVVKDWERWYVSKWEWRPLSVRKEGEGAPPLQVAPPSPHEGEGPCAGG